MTYSVRERFHHPNSTHVPKHVTRALQHLRHDSETKKACIKNRRPRSRTHKNVPENGCAGLLVQAVSLGLREPRVNPH